MEVRPVRLEMVVMALMAMRRLRMEEMEETAAILAWRGLVGHPAQGESVAWLVLTERL